MWTLIAFNETFVKLRGDTPMEPEKAGLHGNIGGRRGESMGIKKPNHRAQINQPAKSARQPTSQPASQTIDPPACESVNQSGR